MSQIPVVVSPQSEVRANTPDPEEMEKRRSQRARSPSGKRSERKERSNSPRSRQRNRSPPSPKRSRWGHSQPRCERFRDWRGHLHQVAPPPGDWRPAPPPNRSLKVYNLSIEVTNGKLGDAFRGFGHIEKATHATDDYGQPLGFGFLRFKHQWAAEWARREMDGMYICGQQIRVEFKWDDGPHGRYPGHNSRHSKHQVKDLRTVLSSKDPQDLRTVLSTKNTQTEANDKKDGVDSAPADPKEVPNTQAPPEKPEKATDLAAAPSTPAKLVRTLNPLPPQALAATPAAHAAAPAIFQMVAAAMAAAASQPLISTPAPQVTAGTPDLPTMPATPKPSEQPDVNPDQSDQWFDLPDGWRKQIVTRKTGNTAGTCDVYVHPPGGGKRLRSTNEIAQWVLANPNGAIDLASVNMSVPVEFKMEGKIEKTTLSCKEEYDKKTALSCKEEYEKKTGLSCKIQEEHDKKILNILNNGGKKELGKLMWLGGKRVTSILSYRELGGKFDCFEDLKKVGGITQKIFDNIIQANHIVLTVD